MLFCDLKSSVIILIYSVSLGNGVSLAPQTLESLLMSPKVFSLTATVFEMPPICYWGFWDLDLERSEARGNPGRRYRDRTCDPLIKSQAFLHLSRFVKPQKTYVNQGF